MRGREGLGAGSDSRTGDPAERASDGTGAAEFADPAFTGALAGVGLAPVLDALPQAVFVVADGGFVVHANDAAVRVAGGGRRSVLGARWVDLLHPDDRAAGASTGTHRVRFADGEGGSRWCDVRATRVGDAGGRVTIVVCAELHERRQGEEATRQLLDSMPVMAYTLDVAGQVDYVNPQVVRYTGLAPSLLTKRQLLTLVHPDDVHSVRAGRELAQAAGADMSLDYRLRGRDEQYRWFRGHDRPIRDREGRELRRVGVLVDIHENKIAERTLRESDGRLRTMLGALPQLIYTATADARVDYVNDQVVAYTGVCADELTGDGWQRVVHADDLPVVQRTVATALGGAAEVQCEQRLRGHDGQYRWFLTRARPVRDAAGRVVQWVGSLTDIDDAKLAQQALRESETQLRQMADAMPQIVWATRPDGLAESYNRRWYEYTGLPEGPEDRWLEVVHPDERDESSARWAQSLATGEPYDVQYRLRRRDGAYRWFIGRAEPIRDEAGRIVRWFGTCTDIDEQKRSQERAAVAKTHAEAASALKDRFLATLSHELRTPLNPAMMLLNSIIEDAPVHEAIREDLVTVKRNLAIETRLIDDLLDVNRIIQGKLSLRSEPVALHAVVREAARATLAERKRVVLWRLDATADGLAGDPVRLEQVFWNILRNATKFTGEEDGAITVTSSNPQPDRIRITITDNGLGIEPQDLKRIFGAFEQGGVGFDHALGGLGLGLTIAKGITELHHGSISAASSGAGQGASFTIELPVRPVESVTPERPTPVAGPTGAVHARLLLVEDHPDTRRVTARLLTRQGHAVTTAGSVEEALRCVRSQTFDVIVSDIGLPDGTGYDLMRRIGDCRIPAIALTGFGTQSDIDQSHEAGFVRHLTKPINIHELYAAIQVLVAPRGE